MSMGYAERMGMSDARGAVLGGGLAAAVWPKVSAALRAELGDAAFNSWLGQARLMHDASGGAVLVTPTVIARDWVRRNVWRRMAELWGQYDPSRRLPDLKARIDVCEDDLSASLVGSELAADPAEAPIVRAALAGPAEGLAGGAARGLRCGGLIERHTFDGFVSGPANEFAFGVAKRVAAWTEDYFNPVVLHGPYGFGKTHLLNAIAWEAMRSGPDRKVVYLTAERFLSAFVKAMMDRSGPAFKDDLRTADLLLIDDVHFIAGKHSSQEELFHTLVALTQEGRRVVLSADRPPNALTEMDARLRSHLQAGLVCGIEPADRALRLGILERKLDQLSRQQRLSAAKARPEVLQFLADRFSDSVRELEGALNTLVARVGERVASLSLDEAQAILRPHLRGAEKRITVDDIQKACAEHYGMKQADLISERRNRAIARPRQAAMWLAKQLTTRSLPDIGRRFGGRDHTTVLHAVRRIDQLRAEDAQLARDLEVLARKLRG
jgi:chromosomal replication initiator protein